MDQHNPVCQTLELFSQDNQQSDINSNNKSDNKSDNNHDQETVPKAIEIALEASENTEGRISTDPKKSTRREKPDAGSKQPSRRRTDHKEDVVVVGTGNPQSISTGMYYYDGTGFQPIRDPQMPSEIGPMAMSDDGSDFLLVQGAMSHPGRRFRAELGRRVLANPGHDVNVSTSMTDPETLNVSINVSLNIAELLRSHQGSTNGNRNTCQTLELFSQDNQQSDINSDNKSDNKSDNNHDQETIPKTIEIALEASEYTEGRISTDSKKATRREKPDAGMVVGTGNPQSISTGMYYYDGTGFQRIREPQMPSEIGPMAMSDDGSDFLLAQGAMSRDGRRSDRPKSAYKNVDSIYPGRRFRAELGRRVLANPGHDVNVSTSMTDPETLNVSINVSLNIAELLRSYQ
ncbi:hypothetical protein MAR_008132, partial [Mya arenaria]